MLYFITGTDNCGTLNEVAGVILPFRDRRVSAEVAKQRVLGFRYDGFEEMAARIDRLKNPPLRSYQEQSRREPPPARWHDGFPLG